MTHASRRLFSAIFALLAATHAVSASTQIAAWDFDSFDPATDTSIASGANVFDWANIGAANTSSVPGVSGTGIQFANISDPAKYFDISLDLTGLDIPILYLSGARSSSLLGGSWSYSVDGGTSFIPTDFTQGFSTGSSYRSNTVIFESTDLRNQDDVVLRYTFSGSTPASAATAKFDNFSVSAVNATQIATFVAGGVTNQRALVGLPTALAPQVNFAISERTGASAQYTVDGSNITIPPPFVSGTMPVVANARTSIPVKLDATGAVAGDVITAQLNVHNVANAETSSASMDFQMVGNRAITTGTSGNFGNIGRIVADQSFGRLEYSGGEAADTHATRITQNAGQFVAGAYVASSDLLQKGTGSYVVMQSAGQVFNDANKTSLVDLVFPAWAGYGNKSLTIENFNARSFGTWIYNNNYIELKSPNLLRGEGLAGEVLDLEGVTLNVHATVLQNRQITGGIVTVGRQMVTPGGPTNLIVSGSTIANLSGGALSDNVATRVNLAAGTTGLPGVAVTTSETNFNGANITSAATVDYHFEVNTTQTGATQRSVNLAPSLSDGEAASTGATVQSTLQVGAKYAVVADRQLNYNENVYVAAIANRSFQNQNIGQYIGTSGGDDYFTRLTVDGVLFDGGEDYIYDSAFYGTLNTGSATSSYQHFTTGSASVVGEGLVGETVNQVGYNVWVKYVDSASVSATPSASGALGNGSSIALAAASAGAGARASAYMEGALIGNSGFSINGSNAQYFYDSLAAGSFDQLDIAFDSLGRMNGTHTATLYLSFYNTYSDGQNNYLLTQSGPVSQYSFDLRHTVFGASGQTGNATVASGGSLKDSGIGLSYTGSFTNEAGFLDSETLAEDIDIQIAYIDASTAPEAKLASDIVHVEGLDGIKFVMQLKYSEVAMISLFGAEEYAQINWLNEDYGLWMNAIYGNSDQGLTGQKFLMSYDSYLGQGFIDGTPRLSDFGVDVVNNVVWAVLDHNSEFGSSGPTASAVPEPSTYALLGLGAALVFLARRRARRTT